MSKVIRHLCCLAPILAGKRWNVELAPNDKRFRTSAALGLSNDAAMSDFARGTGGAYWWGRPLGRCRRGRKASAACP
eukprot:1158212-Pelagomonas_calceolata.AAC.2